MATRTQIDAAITAAGQPTNRGDASDVIATLGQQYRDIRSLMDRVLAAGVNWEFGGDLKADVEMIVAEHDR